MLTPAVQLYTLREYTKTPADIAKTLKRVKKMGYNAVQCSALGKIDAKELASILKNEGLVCCATHQAADRMRDKTAELIEEHKLWGCELTAVGGFFPKNEEGKPPVSAQTWVDWAKEYNAIAKKFEGSGVRIGYHNHSHELAHFDGKPAMQILMETLDPSVWIEIDTYWIAHGGADPAAWITKAKGRVPAVHFKDMLIKLDRTQYMAEVGVGNLNWPSILDACRGAGVKWAIVEQDTCYRDPFDSLETSLKNLKSWGL